MLKDMSRLELSIWFAHVHMGSLDDEATDVRFAMVASAAMNGPHFRRQDKKAYTVRDFLPAPFVEPTQVVRDIKAFFLPRMKKDK